MKLVNKTIENEINDLVNIGYITKAHGVKGWVKCIYSLRSLSYQTKYEKNNKFVYFEYDTKVLNIQKNQNVFVENTQLQIESFNICDANFIILIKFNNLNSYESVQWIRGNLMMKRCDLVQQRNMIYEHEIIDMSIIQNEQKIGNVIAVHDFGAGIVFDTTENFMVSCNFIENICKNSRTMILSPLFIF